MKFLLTVVFTSLFYLSHGQRLVVGTYTNNSPSKGIHVFNFDANTGKANEVSAIEVANPSYLAVSKNGKFIYSVNENDEGKVSAFQYNKTTGKLALLNTENNNGSAPCYVSIDGTGKWLFAGNYGSGDLSVHAIKNNGSISPAKQQIKHSGSSFNKDRQEKPHVHCTYISPDNKLLYVPDLGIDRVMIYPFNAASGVLDTLHKTSIRIEPGGGPRHIVFSKNGKYGYIIEELSGSIDVILREGNTHTIVQKVNHLPAGEAGAAADIHLSPDEKFLYASHRSNNTIEIYKVSAKNGSLVYVGKHSSLGKTPRNFTIHPSGKFLLAGNQNSNEIAVLKRDIKTGLLSDSGRRISVGKPVCLQWVF